jgi:hypothetical protein
MRFYFEPEPFNGMTDMMSVQSVGQWGDNYFIVEAETEEEATAKLLYLLEKRVLNGSVRPATEEESKEFEEFQYQDWRDCENAARIAEAFKEDRLKRPQEYEELSKRWRQFQEELQKEREKESNEKEK